MHAHEKFSSLTRCVCGADAQYIYRTTIILNLIDFFDIRSHKCTRRTSSTISLCLHRKYCFFLFLFGCCCFSLIFPVSHIEYWIFDFSFPLAFVVLDCYCCLNNMCTEYGSVPHKMKIRRRRSKNEKKNMAKGRQTRDVAISQTHARHARTHPSNSISRIALVNAHRTRITLRTC